MVLKTLKISVLMKINDENIIVYLWKWNLMFYPFLSNCLEQDGEFRSIFTIYTFKWVEPKISDFFRISLIPPQMIPDIFDWCEIFRQNMHTPNGSSFGYKCYSENPEVSCDCIKYILQSKLVCLKLEIYYFVVAWNFFLTYFVEVPLVTLHFHA